jgi:hypothetical protein
MKPSMNILQAMGDRRLFGPHFKGDTWARWRVFLAALFALPLDDDAVAIYRQHTGRTEAPTVPFREASLICGRRGGKSRVLALIATFLAAFRDYTPHLAAGEVATVGIIAADRMQARNILRYILGFLADVPLLAGLQESKTTDSVSLTNRVVIEVHTASFRVTRGYSYAAVLADELAFWRSEDSANPDTEIMAALRPGLASIPGSMLLKASSPYAKRGVLWNDFRRYFGQDGASVLVWRGTTSEMNPSIDPALIAAAYEDDPANAAAEYGDEFRSDIDAFVARDVVEACTVAGRFELPHSSRYRYVAFVDPSGGSADSMTLAVAHLDADMPTLDALREVRPPFSPESVVTEFAALLKTYNLKTVIGDRYAGEWPRERFREHGITYQISDRAKSDLYRDLLPLLNSTKARLLDHPRLAAQLCGLERRTSRGGRDTIDHPPGAHDDIANSVAGALLNASARQARPAYTTKIDFMQR